MTLHEAASQIADNFWNCFFNSFRLTTKNKISALLGLYEGNAPMTEGFPSRRASDAESGSMLWRHREQTILNQNRKRNGLARSESVSVRFRVIMTYFPDRHDWFRKPLIGWCKLCIIPHTTWTILSVYIQITWKLNVLFLPLTTSHNYHARAHDYIFGRLVSYVNWLILIGPEGCSIYTGDQQGTSPDSHGCGYHPGTLSCSQVSANHLNIGHP